MERASCRWKREKEEGRSAKSPKREDAVFGYRPQKERTKEYRGNDEDANNHSEDLPAAPLLPQDVGGGGGGGGGTGDGLRRGRPGQEEAARARARAGSHDRLHERP